MDKDKVNTEEKLSLLWNHGLSQLFKKKKKKQTRQVTAHLLYIKLRSVCVCVCTSQLYNSRLQLNTSNSLELPW